MKNLSRKVKITNNKAQLWELMDELVKKEMEAKGGALDFKEWVDTFLREMYREQVGKPKICWYPLQLNPRNSNDPEVAWTRFSSCVCILL